MQKESKKPIPGRRSLLTLASGVTGLALGNSWIKPIVQSTVLPAHATATGCELSITNVQFSEEECFGGSNFLFTLTYDFTSTCGVVSHVVTGACGNDTLRITDAGLPNDGVGINLLNENTANSFEINPGDQFGGTVTITLNRVQGEGPDLSCDLTITLTDANGGQVANTPPLNVNENCTD